MEQKTFNDLKKEFVKNFRDGSKKKFGEDLFQYFITKLITESQKVEHLINISSNSDDATINVNELTGFVESLFPCPETKRGQDESQTSQGVRGFEEPCSEIDWNEVVEAAATAASSITGSHKINHPKFDLMPKRRKVEYEEEKNIVRNPLLQDENVSSRRSSIDVKAPDVAVDDYRKTKLMEKNSNEEIVEKEEKIEIILEDIINLPRFQQAFRTHPLYYDGLLDSQ